MANTQAQGKIVQCIGAVVDVEFPRDQMPRVYDALKLDGSPLTLEVQQQLGDGVVRPIALGSSDGLRRGLVLPGPNLQLQRGEDEGAAGGGHGDGGGQAEADAAEVVLGKGGGHVRVSC